MNEQARILRDQTLALREQDCVQSGRALGASHRRLIVRFVGDGLRDALYPSSGR